MDEFTTLLNTYKDNYSAYRVTGNMAHKVAYESALNSLNARLDATRKILADDAKMVQDFLAKYEDTNPRLMELRDRSREIQDTAPALENQYEVSKRLRSAPIVQPVDDTYLYIKGSIVVALLVVIGIAGTL
jgi:hypothetical protein